MSASPDRIVHLRDLFRSVWPEAVGGTPSRAALQVALGICGVEGWGNWDGEMWGSNNFGGVQCLPGQEANGDGVRYVGVPHLDHHYDGTEYTTWFRYYIEGGGHTAEENGAIDFLRTVALRKKKDGSTPALEPLRRGSAYDTAKAMHDTGYYEGSPPDPVAGYADGIVKNATLAASALGEPVLVGGSGGNMKRNALLFGAGLAIAHGMGWL